MCSSYPWEVIEHIIDLLRFDVFVLCSLALTCRDLLPRSRYHLFYALRFQPTLQDVDALCRFFDIHPKLSLRVHAVTVYSHPHPAIEVCTPRLLIRFRRLRHWKLLIEGNPNWVAPLSYHSSTLAFIKTALHIQELEFHGFYFTSNAEITRVLVSFPQLHQLRCSDIHCRNRRSPSLTSLRRRPGLQLFRLSIMEDVEIMVVRLLLELASATLNHLDICYLEKSTLTVVHVFPDERFSLPKLPYLHSLTLLTGSQHLKEGVSPLKRVETILRNISAPSLQHLRLQISPTLRPSLSQEYTQMLWRSLEPLLASGKQFVTIEIVGGRQNRLGWWTAELKRALPMLHAELHLAIECRPVGLDNLLGHEGSVRSLTFSPDGRWITTASDDKAIMLWDPQKGVVAQDWLIPYQYEAVTRTTLIFSPNSHQLASCGTRDGRVIIWDISDGRRLATLYDTSDELDDATPRLSFAPDSTCAWSPDGTRLATISHNDHTPGVVRIWDTNTYQQMSTFVAPPGYTGPLCSTDSSWWGVFDGGCAEVVGAIGTGDGAASTEPRRAITTSKGITVSSFHASTMRIAVSFRDGTLSIWNLYTGEKMLCLQRPHIHASTHRTYAKVVQFSPGGAVLLSVEEGTGAVDIWDSIGGEWLRSLGYDQHYQATTARFSLDGRYVASGHQDGTVRLWNTVDWSAAAVFAGHPLAVSRVAFSSDGELLVSGAKDGSVCVRNLQDLRVRGWIQDACTTGASLDRTSPVSG